MVKMGQKSTWLINFSAWYKNCAMISQNVKKFVFRFLEFVYLVRQTFFSVFRDFAGD